MFIYGLKNLTESVYQFAQDKYNKTAEYAKSIFENLSATFSSTRSMRIYSVIVLTWTVTLVEASQQLVLSDKCCGPAFFGNVLLVTCQFFKQNFTNSEARLHRHSELLPQTFTFECRDCLLTAPIRIIWNSDIRRMGWKQGAYDNSTARFAVYNNTPTINIFTNCSLDFPVVTIREHQDKFLAIIREEPKIIY